MNMTHTIETTKAVNAFERIQPVMNLVHGVIAAAGPEGLPSGHLYAQLMGYMSLSTYQNLIDVMVKAGGITLKNHVLRAVDAE
jgi:hypothetical protein